MSTNNARTVTGKAGLRRSPNDLRTAFWATGAVALVVGMLVLAWPTKTAQVLTAMVAVYAVVGGVVYVSLGVFSHGRSRPARVGLTLSSSVPPGHFSFRAGTSARHARAYRRATTSHIDVRPLFG